MERAQKLYTTLCVLTIQGTLNKMLNTQSEKAVQLMLRFAV
jgi:hypothetical protein